MAQLFINQNNIRFHIINILFPIMKIRDFYESNFKRMKENVAEDARQD